MKNNNIGGYGLTFGEKCKYIYRAHTNCSAYFIRKNNWLRYLNHEDTREIAPCVKERLKKRYKMNIEKNLKILKRETLKKQAGLSHDGEVIQMSQNPYA